MKSPIELALAFRAQGFTVTPQRQLLFSLLEDGTTHPTVIDGDDRCIPQSASIVIQRTCASCAHTSSRSNPHPKPDSTPELQKEHHHG